MIAVDLFAGWGGFTEGATVAYAANHWPLAVEAHAMGFRDSYVWPKGKRRDAIRGLGNAVCPPVARAVVAAVMGAM